MGFRAKTARPFFSKQEVPIRKVEGWRFVRLVREVRRVRYISEQPDWFSWRWGAIPAIFGRGP